MSRTWTFWHSASRYPIHEVGKVYAVKTVSREKVKTEIQLLHRELKLLRDLDHPNIIKLHETYQNGEFYHFVMEYCAGGNLMEYFIKHTHLREGDIAKIMTQAFSAVKYLNENGIVHRDIKPDNFIFSSKASDADLKLIDFGLSRTMNPDTKLSTRAGTPLYIAPEVLQGSYDEKCDYWSLGVMLYFFLSHHFPFDGANVAEIAKNIQKNKPSFEGKNWEGVSAEGIDLCKKLLEHDPAKRITVTEALEHPWIKHVAQARRIDRAAATTIVSNLRAFSTDIKFKREILNVLLFYLNEKELKQLHDAFAYFDKDRSGSISPADLKTVIKENNLQISDEELEEIMARVDIDQSHMIKYSEFMIAALDSSYYLSKEKLWNAFRHFDVDNSNYITSSNIREALARSGRRISVDELNEMVKETEVMKNGKLDFNDFCSLVQIDEFKSNAKTPSVSDVHKNSTLRLSNASGKVFFPDTH